MTVDVTWDGFDASRQTLRVSVSPQVHREAPRSRRRALSIEHFKTHPTHAEVAPHLFTDENEYYWRDESGAEAAPPWTPGQQVIFKMKPWSKENTAGRQQKRPRPPTSDGKDPLGLFSHFYPVPPSSLTGGAGGADAGTPTQPAGGTADQLGQYHSLARPCPKRQVDITVMAEGRTTRIKAEPKILIQNLVHRVAQALTMNLPGWWHASVVDGIGDNHTYQENDTIKPCPASQESVERMRDPRTPQGSVAKILKAIGGPCRRGENRRRKEIGFGNCVKEGKPRFKTRNSSRIRLLWTR
jgi:hypothetical protein